MSYRVAQRCQPNSRRYLLNTHTHTHTHTHNYTGGILETREEQIWTRYMYNAATIETNFWDKILHNAKHIQIFKWQYVLAVLFFYSKFLSKRSNANGPSHFCLKGGTIVNWRCKPPTLPQVQAVTGEAVDAVFTPFRALRITGTGCTVINVQLTVLPFVTLSLIHIWRCRRITGCRSRWSPYH